MHKGQFHSVLYKYSNYTHTRLLYIKFILYKKPIIQNMSETELPTKNPLPLAKASDSDEGEESKNKKSSTGYF